MSNKNKTKSSPVLTDEELNMLLNQVNTPVEANKDTKKEEAPKVLYSGFGVAKTGDKTYEIFEMEFDPISGFSRIVEKVKTDKKILTKHQIPSVLIPSIQVLLETRLKKR